MTKKHQLPRIKLAAQGRQRMKLYRVPVETSEEGLVGMVRGMEASAPEERLARALDQNPMVSWFKFRQVYNAPRNTSGAIELDFLINVAGVLIPAQVDETYFHAHAAEWAKDRVRDNILNELLRTQGARRVSRIRADYLETIASAKLIVEALIFGRVFTIE